MKLNQIIQVKLLLVPVLALERNGAFLLFLCTVLTTKGVIYFSAWSLYLCILTSKSTSLCFIHICEGTEALEFPCCTSGSHSLWPSLCCSSERRGTSRDKQWGESFKNPGAEDFLQLKVFLISHIFNYEHKVHWQLLTWLFLHKGFLPNASSFQIFGLCHTTAILIQWDIPKAHCSVSICQMPTLHLLQRRKIWI